MSGIPASFGLVLFASVTLPFVTAAQSPAPAPAVEQPATAAPATIAPATPKPATPSVILPAAPVAAQPAAPATTPPAAPVAAPPAAPVAAPAAAPSTAPPAAPTPEAKVLPAEQVGSTELTGLLSHSVVGPKGAVLGRVADILIDENGRMRAVVVDTGGFMGVGNRKVAVAWSALRFSPGAKAPVISIMIDPERIKSWADYIPGRPVAILGATAAAQ